MIQLSKEDARKFLVDELEAEEYLDGEEEECSEVQEQSKYTIESKFVSGYFSALASSGIQVEPVEAGLENLVFDWTREGAFVEATLWTEFEGPVGRVSKVENTIRDNVNSVLSFEQVSQTRCEVRIVV